jgi:hypothetical protein
MLKFLKMMVAEDVITTEEVLVVVVLVAEEVLPRREEFCTKRKVQAVVEATETQVQRRWIWWKKLCSKRRRFWRKKFSSRGVLQTELKTF